MTSTAELLTLKRTLNSGTDKPTKSNTGYSASHIYSRSPEATHSEILGDIKSNGFQVKCIKSGIVFNVKPGSSICRGMIEGLEHEGAAAWRRISNN
ncbi:MAG: hypothetical protein P0Y63_24755 [Klebsiella huaxiensis]|uniref:hypothetical protein n=1 Tax=Klebsiella huaxiensis TaxID=2153354 RepID=UPI0026EF0B15|nr:hypothetical protein [Klebsiella huaxiensis]WEJ88457.1 MAG: hypothetical protein P0Y63_24755 [Klebsiella huaxiensis]